MYWGVPLKDPPSKLASSGAKVPMLKRSAPTTFKVLDRAIPPNSTSSPAAFIVFAKAAVTPNPMSTAAEMSDTFSRRPRGIQRITRHPANLAFTLFAVGHMFSNPYVGDWVFFGGFVVFGIVSTMHQDRRTLASGRPEVAQFQSETSQLPFVAVFSGKQRLALMEYNKGALVAGIALAGVLWYVHPVIFGGYGAA